MDNTPIPDATQNISVFRILDANCNRLREALRVVEEHARFVQEDGDAAMLLKTARHDLQTILSALGENDLLSARNTASDPFAVEVQEIERGRADMRVLLAANIRRAQEAARVIEEYAKLLPCGTAVEKAKHIRFMMYDAEKKLLL